MKIERVELHRLEIPLTRPYRLAFGPVTQYDTIVVEVDRRRRRAWFRRSDAADRVHRRNDRGQLHARVRDRDGNCRERKASPPAAQMIALGARAPFVATAFHTALDMAAGHPLLAPRRAIRVPILGLLQGDGEGGAARCVRAPARRWISHRQGQDRLRRRGRPPRTRDDPDGRRGTRRHPRRCESRLHGGGSRRVHSQRGSGGYRALRATVRGR